MCLINSLGTNTVLYDKHILRKFGLILTGIIYGILLFIYYRTGNTYLYILISTIILSGISIVFPSLIKYLYIPWMILALLIGSIVTRFILTLFYIVIITPYGLIKNTLGLLRRQKNNSNGSNSYWLKKDDKKPSMERMF